MSKLLSIVIPSYNMEAYLERCIASLKVRDGLFEKLDVIIVNDGSRDKTGEVGGALSARYPGVVRIVNKSNGNYGSCVNRGIAEAKAFYLKVLDADDTFDIAGLERLMAVLEDERKSPAPADVILSDYDKRSFEGDILFSQTLSQLAGEPFDIEKILPVLPSICMPVITYRRELLTAMGYRQTEGISYTDNEFVIFPMAYARKLVYCGAVVYHYLIGREGQTISRLGEKRSVQMYIKLFETIAALRSRLPSGTLDASRRFVDGYIYHLVTFVYDNIIWRTPLNDFCACMSSWDALVSERFPEMHARARARKIRIVKNWRHVDLACRAATSRVRCFGLAMLRVAMSCRRRIAAVAKAVKGSR